MRQRYMKGTGAVNLEMSESQFIRRIGRIRDMISFRERALEGETGMGKARAQQELSSLKLALACVEQLQWEEIP